MLLRVGGMNLSRRASDGVQPARTGRGAGLARHLDSAIASAPISAGTVQAKYTLLGSAIVASISPPIAGPTIDPDAPDAERPAEAR